MAHSGITWNTLPWEDRFDLFKTNPSLTHALLTNFTVAHHDLDQRVCDMQKWLHAFVEHESALHQDCGRWHERLLLVFRVLDRQVNQLNHHTLNAIWSDLLIRPYMPLCTQKYTALVRNKMIRDWYSVFVNEAVKHQRVCSSARG